MPKMILDDKTMTEENFSRLLPTYLQRVSKLYFTPIHIAKIAAQWLTESGKQKILDIGAGVGKFCIAAAKHTDSHFYGIEYRLSLVNLANELINHYDVPNATILHNDVVDVDFSDYDAFYLYNPFYENLIPSKRLNNEVELASSRYRHYLSYTENQLHKTRSGTRLVTFHGNNLEIPGSFVQLKEAEDGLLQLWERL
jgi:type I restriction-modification system DNA methylase subunit